MTYVDVSYIAMLPSYLLKCSVCKGDYFSKTAWLRHLTTEDHQVFARKEFFEEWDSKEMRECCLVVFSTFPMTLESGGSDNCGEGDNLVLKHFSKQFPTFVTDFVWWEERDRIGVLQFESGSKLEEIFSSYDEKVVDILIDDKRVQVKRALDLLEVEWCAIFPDPSDSTRPLRASASEPSSTFVPRRIENPCKSVAVVPPQSAELKINEIEEGNGGGNGTTVPENQQDLLKTSNSVYILAEFARKNQWGEPTYRLIKNKRNQVTRYTCMVTVNGVKYPPKSFVPEAISSSIARQIAASNCLETLASSTPTMKTSQLDNTATMHSSEDTSAEHGDKLKKRPVELISHEDQNEERISTKKLKVDDNGLSKVTMTLSCSRSGFLQNHFYCVRRCIGIPDEDYYGKALHVRNTVKALFSISDSTAEVVMFRNWYLKLRSPISSDNDPLLLYVYCERSQPAYPSGITFVSDRVIGEVFNLPHAQKDFTVVEAVDRSSNDSGGSELMRWKVKHNPSNLHFYVVTYLKFFMEVQMCRMLDYMCTFDPRCHSLMTLVYYWSSVNSALIGSNKEYGKISHLTLPEPLTLQWLVMFFLCHKKIVPTPREIQERPHQVFKDRQFRTDVGFNADLGFIEEWKSKRALIDPKVSKNVNENNQENISNAIILFQEFLEFFGEHLETGNWLLNTRDGELISTDKFLNAAPNHGDPKSESYWSTKMMEEEILSLKSLQRNQVPPNQLEDKDINDLDSNADAPKLVQYQVDFKAWKLYIIHPFVFTCRFSVSRNIQTVLKKMKKTGAGLKTYLHDLRKNGGTKAARKKLRPFKEVLKTRLFNEL